MFMLTRQQRVFAEHAAMVLCGVLAVWFSLPNDSMGGCACMAWANGLFSELVWAELFLVNVVFYAVGAVYQKKPVLSAAFRCLSLFMNFVLIVLLTFSAIIGTPGSVFVPMLAFLSVSMLVGTSAAFSDLRDALYYGPNYNVAVSQAHNRERGASYRWHRPDSVFSINGSSSEAGEQRQPRERANNQ